jgi:dephospho-CoA kinase
MKCIGLTGGIGSGKTTVARIFSMLNVPVYNSDEAGRKITNKDPLVKSSIKEQFGADMFDNQDNLNREKLSAIVFNDSSALSKLNAIIHPAVAHDFKMWCANQSSPFVIKETAILFEHGLDKQLDGVIVVEAPDDLRIKRVMHRNGITEDAVRQRIQQQLPQDELISRADWVIHNNEEQLLIPQVLEIYSRITA